MKIAKLFKAACCVLLYSLFPLFASAADDPVPKFEKFILEAMNATKANTPVNLNSYTQAWAKKRFSVADIKFDVKKTDSLVNPIVGLVTFQLVNEQTGFFPTKEEAEASTEFDPKNLIHYRISLFYSYKDAKWSFSKGSYENLDGLKGSVFDLSEENMRNNPTRIPNIAILYWLPK